MRLTPPDAVGLLTTHAFPPGRSGGAHNPGDLGSSGGVRGPGGPRGDASNSTDSDSRKAPAGPKAQAVTTWALRAPLAGAQRVGKCPPSKKARGSSGKGNNVCAIARLFIRPVTSQGIQTVIKPFKNRSLGLDSFTSEILPNI